MNVILIALGGALGAVLRYASVSLTARIFGPGFPMGVMAVNVAGSFAMGLVAAYLLERTGGSRGALFLATGVLGGFTTFSAFSLDAVGLIEAGRFGAATAYVGGSVALAILALYAGLVLGRSMA